MLMTAPGSGKVPLVVGQEAEEIANLHSEQVGAESGQRHASVHASVDMIAQGDRSSAGGLPPTGLQSDAEGAHLVEVSSTLGAAHWSATTPPLLPP